MVLTPFIPSSSLLVRLHRLLLCLTVVTRHTSPRCSIVVSGMAIMVNGKRRCAQERPTDMYARACLCACDWLRVH